MNVKADPQVSVVMPVHNALPFLDESIRSILEQTFKDFEFVILDDASSDGSTQLLREWSQRDARIRLQESTEQLGLSGSSNAVVLKTQARIVARMDADDVSHPDRLRRQLIGEQALRCGKAIILPKTQIAYGRCIRPALRNVTPQPALLGQFIPNIRHAGTPAAERAKAEQLRGDHAIAQVW